MSSPQSTASQDGGDTKKTLEQITFRFCSECSNMLYPKEDPDSQQLQYTCRTCSNTEAATTSCVFRHILNNAAGETAGVTQDVGSDPTVGIPSRNPPTCACPACKRGCPCTCPSCRRAEDGLLLVLCEHCRCAIKCSGCGSFYQRPYRHMEGFEDLVLRDTPKHFLLFSDPFCTTRAGLQALLDAAGNDLAEVAEAEQCREFVYNDIGKVKKNSFRECHAMAVPDIEDGFVVTGLYLRGAEDPEGWHLYQT